MALTDAQQIEIQEEFEALLINLNADLRVSLELPSDKALGTFGTTMCNLGPEPLITYIFLESGEDIRNLSL